MLNSPTFWSFVLLGLAVLRLWTPGSAVRTLLLILLNAAGLHLALGMGTLDLALTYGSASWVAFWAVLRPETIHRRPDVASLLLISPLVVVWSVGKFSASGGAESLQYLSVLGYSYLLIKSWTLLKDVCDERLNDVRPHTVFAYLTFFPTHLAGPMHYFREFEAALGRPTPIDAERCVDHVFRIVVGLVKINLLAPLFTPLSLVALREVDGFSLATLMKACFAYSFVVYLDFSGYCDVVISAARLMGIDIPENFNAPYLARNVREFWQRWHITFTRVLTSYVFIMISRRLNDALGGRPKLVSALAVLATFLFCGYWHGPTANFLLWGLYHAVGIIVYDQYRQRTAKARLLASRQPPREGLALWRQRVRHCLDVAATFAFVSLGWMLFVLPIPRLLKGLGLP